MCKKIKMQPSDGKVELSILESSTCVSMKDGEPKDKINRFNDNEDNENEHIETEIFDTVLCTVPLGVLKVINLDLILYMKTKIIIFRVEI